MAVAYRADSTGTGTDASAEGTIPTGTQDGDLMVAFLAHSSSGATISSAASGWTLLEPDPNPADFSAVAYYRIKQSGDSNPTWTWSAAGNWVVDIISFSGIDQTTPINVDTGEQVAANNSIALGAITPTVNDTMLAGWACVDASGGARTWTQTGSMTEIIEQTDNQLHRAAAYELLSGGSGSGFIRTFTVSGSAQDIGGFLLAIAPATGGGSTVFGAASADFTVTVGSAGARVGLGAAAVDLTVTVGSQGLHTATGSSTLELAAGISSQGTLETFGSSTVELTAGVSSQGVRETFGSSTVGLTATVGAQGLRTATGSSTAGLTVGIDSQGVRTTFGVSTAALTVGVGSQGVRTTFGVSDVPITLTISTTVGNNVFGAAAASFTVGVTTAGTHTATGSVTLGLTAGVDTTGAATGFGAASFAVTLGVGSSGSRTRLGASDLAITAGVATAGNRTRFGAADVPLTLTIATSPGAASTAGAASLTVTFGASVGPGYGFAALAPDTSLALAEEPEETTLALSPMTEQTA